MFSSLRAKLALSHLGLILFTTGVLGVLTFTLLVDFHKKGTFALLERSATSNSLQVQQYFSNKSFLLQTIISSKAIEAYSKKHQATALMAYSKQFQHEFVTLSYISPLGNEEVRMGNGAMAEGLRAFSNAQLIKKAVETPDEVFYDVKKADHKSYSTIEFVIAPKNYFGDELLCLIYATTSSSELEKHLSSFSEDMTDNLIITDAQQTIILHPDHHLIGTPLALNLSAFGFAKEETLGIQGIYASLQLAKPNWKITRIMPYGTYTSVYKQFAKMVLTLLGIVSILGILASLYSARKIIAPIKRLTEAISEVASSKKSEEVERYSIKELDSLVDSFNEMVRKLTKTSITKEYLDNILNSLQEGLFVVSMDGTIESANQRILDLLEISEDEFLGQPMSRFLQEKQVYSFLRNEKQIDIRGLETSLTTATQKSVPIQFFISALFDAEDDKLGFVCLTLDISHRQKIENEKDQLRYQLHQSQRLESVGTLASGIAHDFNNILTVVIGFSQLLQDKVEDDQTCKNALEHILTASYRAKDLVKQLLAFSRQEDHKKTVITLHPIVKETLKMLRSSIPTYISIEQNISSQAYPVFADHSQIQQVLMNLCTNASYAIKQTGTISVSLDNIQVYDDTTPPYQEIPNGNYAEIVVSDDGQGIKKHNLENIFDPFFTTKDVDEGTGLGLAVVHGIVENLKGHILVHSEENVGTTFRILIPHNDETAPAPLTTADNSGELLVGRGEHILFVDDEQSLVDLLEKVFKQRGYRITATTSPEKAFELFKTDPNDFDILITDFAMPKVKGDELINKIHAIRNDLPVILCTGYHAKLLGMDDITKFDQIIKKPYTANEIIYNIVNILQKPQVS